MVPNRTLTQNLQSHALNPYYIYPERLTRFQSLDLYQLCRVRYPSSYKSDTWGVHSKSNTYLPQGGVGNLFSHLPDIVQVFCNPCRVGVQTTVLLSNQLLVLVHKGQLQHMCDTVCGRTKCLCTDMPDMRSTQGRFCTCQQHKIDTRILHRQCSLDYKNTLRTRVLTVNWMDKLYTPRHTTRRECRNSQRCIYNLCM